MQTIQTDNAPAAVGPYSQGIVHNGLFFTAGQIGLIPESGAMVEGGIEAEVEQVLANLDAIITAAGSGRDKVIKATIYLTDLAHFERVNALYGEFFEDHRPARTTVQVAGLPKGALVEMEMVGIA